MNSIEIYERTMIFSSHTARKDELLNSIFILIQKEAIATRTALFQYMIK